MGVLVVAPALEASGRVLAPFGEWLTALIPVALDADALDAWLASRAVSLDVTFREVAPAADADPPAPAVPAVFARSRSHQGSRRGAGSQQCAERRPGADRAHDELAAAESRGGNAGRGWRRRRSWPGALDRSVDQRRDLGAAAHAAGDRPVGRDQHPGRGSLYAVAVGDLAFLVDEDVRAVPVGARP